ncbi:hypothetical protein [Streptomyces leeuwenhoekii]|uniref:hypothetical protein n=1 Tax=Streptomyces leeuwenhoekii TaxID=1437453 RepID=UPI000A60D406|nr:hypothetical protein [Streptomyces leeuwenhoekii]
MSEETVPQPGGAAAPTEGLLERMEELMAALDADLRPAAGAGRSPRAGERGTPAGPA